MLTNSKHFIEPFLAFIRKRSLAFELLKFDTRFNNARKPKFVSAFAVLRSCREKKKNRIVMFLGFRTRRRVGIVGAEKFSPEARLDPVNETNFINYEEVRSGMPRSSECVR